MFGIPFITDPELKTASGINKLDLMISFSEVLEAKHHKFKTKYLIFKSWLSEQLNRKITTDEEIALLEGILKYTRSVHVTNERIEAMNFLFNAEFLNKNKPQ